MHIGPGHPYPLGATWDGAGVNFALFSAHATGVDLCLFDTPEGINNLFTCRGKPSWARNRRRRRASCAELGLRDPARQSQKRAVASAYRSVSVSMYAQGASYFELSPDKASTPLGPALSLHACSVLRCLAAQAAIRAHSVASAVTSHGLPWGQCGGCRLCQSERR